MASNLKTVLDGKGLRHVWVARQLGVAPQRFSRWVRGESRIPDEYKIPLMELLNCGVEDLIDFERAGKS